MHQQQTAFENIVGKEEMARNDQLLLFPQCFLRNEQLLLFPQCFLLYQIIVAI